MPFIRIKTGPNKGKVFEIKDNVITIGRDENQTIQILDQGVSRAHAEIFRLGDMCFVRDLNSTNGTYVNNVKVTEEAMKHTDELLIGTTILLFEDKITPAPSDVELDGTADDPKIETTTVEIKVDRAKKQDAIGREVTSRNLTTIHEVGRLLSSGRDITSSLRSALERVAEAMGADHGYLFLLDKTSGRLTARASVEQGNEGAEKKVSRTIVKRVMQTGMPLLTTDAALDDRFMLSESVVLKKIKSVVAAPIMIRDKVEGLLYFHAAKLNTTLTVEDLELVATVALQLTMALTSIQAGDRLRGSMFSTIKALVTAMEIIDPKNQGHSERVAGYSVAVGSQLEMPEDDLHRLRLSALLHDVGKLAVHQSLAGVSRDSIREQHVKAGERILANIEGFDDIMPGVRYHHERADGSGFPYKLKNSETPLVARIIIVTNHFDNTVTSGGPNGTPLSDKDVLRIMAQKGGTEFDDDVIKALLLCHRSGTLYAGMKTLNL